jgi:hypothetical protein
MSALRPPSTAWFGLPPLAGLFRREPPARKRIEPTVNPRVRAAVPTIALPGQVDMNKVLAAARVAPKLDLIEWDGDLPALSFQPAATPQGVADERDPRTYDSKRRKIRDRYISTRFPGVAQCSTDLESAERVIKAARLYFEEERNDESLELLELAIEECPRETSLWLARLEILFLSRDAAGYVATARDFRAAHSADAESWAEICRLGRALAPEETVFGARCGPREHEHYGPWPHTPNWIQAPWDLTSEIAAADFHRAMGRLASSDANVKPRLAA